MATGIFLWLQTPDVTNSATLIAFVFSGYLTALVLMWRPSRAILTLYIFGLTVAFVVLKKYAFLRLIGGETLLAHTLDLIGLSFIFFRQIHYVVDVTQGEITRTGLWEYLCYQFNPFTLFAGPIQRYQPFQEDWQRLALKFEDAHEVRMAMLRILLGILKVTVIAEICLHFAFSRPSDLLGEWYRVLVFYLFPAYDYFNFVGYE